MALQPQHANGYAQNYAANGFAPDPAASSSSDHHVIDIPEAHDPHMDRLLTPAAQAAGADERLRCRVSENRKGVVVLSIEEGNVFVLAAKQSGKDWLLGTEVDEHGNFGMRGVVAKMRAHKDGVFTCVRQRGGGHFAQHLGGGETLHCHHSTHTSEELPELNVMTVALPRDGGRSADGATFEWPAGALGQQLRWEFGRAAQNGGGGGAADAPDMSVLQTKVPKWNARSDSFELPFHGRANQARRPRRRRTHALPAAAASEPAPPRRSRRRARATSSCSSAAAPRATASCCSTASSRTTRTRWTSSRRSRSSTPSPSASACTAGEII